MGLSFSPEVSARRYFSGPIQPDARLNTNLPWYVNAWNMSLQIPGASLYLPHWSFGAPSASGP